MLPATSETTPKPALASVSPDQKSAVKIEAQTDAKAVAVLDIKKPNFDVATSQEQLSKGTLKEWDSSGQVVWDEIVQPRRIQVMKVREVGLTAMKVLKNGMAITAGSDHKLEVVDLKGGKSIKLLEGHTAAVRALAETEEGMFLSASDDNSVRLWDPKADFKCVHIFTEHRKPVNALVALPNNQFASGSSDGTVKIVDIATKKVVRTLDLNHSLYWRLFDNDVWALACIPDGLLAVASQDNCLSLWDPITGEKRITFLNPHDSVDRIHLAIDQDGRLACGPHKAYTYSGNVFAFSLWNVKGKYTKYLGAYEVNGPYEMMNWDSIAPVHSMILMSHGRVVSASTKDVVYIQNQFRNSFYHAGVWDQIGHQVAVTPEGNLLIGGYQGKLGLYDIAPTKLRPVHFGDIAPLLPTLADSRSLTKFCLENFPLEDESFASEHFATLISALKPIPSLSTVSFNGSRLCMPELTYSCPDGMKNNAKKLKDWIEESVALTELDLSGVPMGGSGRVFSSGAEQLAFALSKNKHLRCLRLRGTQLNDHDVQAFLPVCREHPTLIELDVRDNPLSAGLILNITEILKAKQIRLGLSGDVKGKISLQAYKIWLREHINQFIQAQSTEHGYLHPERQASVVRVRAIIEGVRIGVVELNIELESYLKTLSMGGVGATFSSYYDNAPFVAMLRTAIAQSDVLTEQTAVTQDMKDIPVSPREATPAVFAAMQQQIMMLQRQVLELKSERASTSHQPFAPLALSATDASDTKGVVSDHDYSELLITNAELNAALVTAQLRIKELEARLEKYGDKQLGTVPRPASITTAVVHAATVHGAFVDSKRSTSNTASVGIPATPMTARSDSLTGRSGATSPTPSLASTTSLFG